MQLISGGQTGVDRAAIDVAIDRGLAYGGWCPQGGWAEDLPEPPGLLAKYPRLKETPLTDPAQRTEWNVRDADACVIVVEVDGMAVSKGTELARKLSHRYRKPLLIVDLLTPQSIDAAPLWLRFQQRRVGNGVALAIGGPRQSEAPGIYGRAKPFIQSLLDIVPEA